MIMNRILPKLIMLMFISVFIFSGCGWEDDETTDGSTDTVIKPGLIEFVSVSSDVIALKGTGNANVSETATLKFKVYGSTGAVLAGTKIDLSLSTDVGGITLSATSATSDTNGEISVNVASGTVITAFTVNAVASENTSIKAVSSEIKITSASVKSLQYISASHDLIALKGTGGSDLTETSELKFKAIDETGNVVTGALVNFETNTTVGGLSLSSHSQKTDLNGEVKVSLISGNIPTSVSVVASLDSNSNIRVISNHVNISTGRATYRGFVMGPEGSNHIIGGLDTFGLEKKIIVQASDIFNNPVPDGTTVNFRTEWGQIDSSCTIQGGQCSVIWKSGGNTSVFAGQNPYGRITIVASVIGEESFTDVNSNGLYDSDDNAFWDPSKDNLSEMFINKSDMVNGAFDSSYDYGVDEFIDDNGNGVWDAQPNNIYNGKLCSDSAEAAGLCSKDLIRIWRSNVIIATHTEPVNSSVIKLYDSSLNPVTDIDLKGVVEKTYYAEVKDSNGNPLPESTEISFSVNKNGTENTTFEIDKNKYVLSNSTGLGLGSTLFPFTIKNKNIEDNSTFVITIKGSGENSRPYNIDTII
ncbi:hypothetical protein [Desulforegula conservatrix]|uniref:hypothetical protein n=1 Tax=Desulforegula conservatrix TaxID=153026 RepID=UPI0004289F6D|nr:hypothetical protein [Desulforegula conservatrix]